MVTAMFTDSEAFALLQAIGEEVRTLTDLLDNPATAPSPTQVRRDLWTAQRAALRTASIAIRDGIVAADKAGIR